MGKYSALKLCFADTETTGLDENKHEVIEIAAVIYDPVADKIVDEWSKKIAPSHIETASPEALRINGYAANPGLYDGNLKSSLIKFNSLAKDCMIIGQNIKFDTKFIRKHMDELGIKPSFGRHQELDLMAMAWPALCNDPDIQGLSLAHLCDYFKVSNLGAHAALTDCRRSFEVYQCLMKIYQRKESTQP